MVAHFSPDPDPDGAPLRYAYPPAPIGRPWTCEPGALPGGFGDRHISRQIDDALIGLRKAGRCAIRILDVGCGDGAWLISTVLRAQMLGFVAIEARGFDIVPALIDRARSIAGGIADHRIGFSFDVADAGEALAQEDDHGADLVLCHYAAIDRLPADVHEAVVAELARVTAGALICLGGTQ